ncbi:MAG TPA: hypothetical protein PLZ79_09605 [Burkholderiales bacterium]|nr:hypothetical protein [Burkholderiales bacterium]
MRGRRNLDGRAITTSFDEGSAGEAVAAFPQPKGEAASPARVFAILP